MLSTSLCIARKSVAIVEGVGWGVVKTHETDLEFNSITI